MVDIKTRCCGEVIATGETHLDALVVAVADGLSLADADLSEIDWVGVDGVLIFDLRLLRADVPQWVIQEYLDGIRGSIWGES